MLKLKNKEKIQSKTLGVVAVTFIFFILIALFLIILSTSCSSILGGSATAKTDVGTNQESSNGNEENANGDTSAQEMSPVEEVDFTNATLSLIHISEPTRLGMISYAVFCLKKKKKKKYKNI